MQIPLQNQTKGRPQLPPKRGNLSVGNKHGSFTISPRSRPACMCLNRPGSFQCAGCGFVVPVERLKIPHGNKQVLRRALTPPPTRRIGLRWFNFRPTPSRLSNMSMA